MEEFSLKRKLTIIVAGLCSLLLIVIGACLFQIYGHSHELLTQQAAQAWRGENELRFAQASAFLPVDKAADENAVFSFRQTINPRLRDDGVEVPKEGTLWADAYSGSGSLQVQGSKGTYAATAIGVGGDFFLFHPYELMSGSYITEDDVMQDRVVLDHELAWKLFGGSDLAGMSVTIGGKPYYVAGVIKRESDAFTQKAFSGEPLIYMSYSAASELIEGLGISCYELVMPDPITNYVQTFVKDNFAQGSCVVVQNTGRYGFGRIYDFFEDFGSRAIQNTGVAFPYWENAARISEEYIARLYVIIAVAGFVPLLCLIWLAAKLIRFIIRKIRYGWAQSKEAWDDRYARIDDAKKKRLSKKESGSGRPRKRTRTRKKSAPEVPPPQEILTRDDPFFDEKAISMDIESIVREIMEENK